MGLAPWAPCQLGHGALVWPWARLLRRLLREKAEKSLIEASQHQWGDFFKLWHSFFVLSWAVTAMPMPHHAHLLWRSWSWLPAWPQTYLTTMTCLAVVGMCWPWLPPPDLLCSAVWLLWDWVSCGGHCPCSLCFGSWPPPESRESKTHSQTIVPALLLLAKGWFPTANIF